MTLIRERNYERDESDDVRNILLISPQFLTELHALRAAALYSGDGRLHALCVLMLRELTGPEASAETALASGTGRTLGPLSEG